MISAPRRASADCVISAPRRASADCVLSAPPVERALVAYYADPSGVTAL